VPQAGFYKVNFTFIPDNIVGNIALGVVIFNHSGAPFPGGGFEQFALSPSTNLQTFSQSFVFQCAAGDIISVYMDGLPSTQSFDIVFARFEVQGEATTALGFELNFKYLLQNWTCRDFLRGVSEIGNTMFETEADGGSIVKEPKDAYFFSYTNKITPPTTGVRTGFYNQKKDWTAKVDLSKKSPLQLKNDIPNRQRWVFAKDDADETVNNIEEAQQFRLYEARFDLPNTRFKVGEQVNECSFFAAQLHIFDSSIMHPDSPIVPQIPIIWNGDYKLNPSNIERPKGYKARFLYWAGGRSTESAGKIWVKFTSGLFSLTTPEVFAVNYNDQTGADPNLTWADVQVNGFTVPGLLSTYHWRDLCRTFSGKYIEEFLFIDDQDINELTFRAKLRIGDDDFELLEVTNYNPLRAGSTKVAIRYDKRDDVLSRSNIQNSPLSGVIAREV
jgi:hypothetical protein